jgi:hypothetical protein
MTNDEEVTGSNKFFFAILGTFGRYVTNLRGTFVKNVKKSKKSTRPIVQYSARVKSSSLKTLFWGDVD